MKASDTDVTTIDEYIDGFPADVQARLSTLRAVIRKAAPDAVEKISYRMPTYYLNGNLVYFAGYARHIGFYPGANGITQFRDRLSAYKSAKGSVQFPHDRPLPLALVKDIVAFRVAENSQPRPRRKNGERR